MIRWLINLILIFVVVFFVLAATASSLDTGVPDRETVFIGFWIAVVISLMFQ